MHSIVTNNTNQNLKILKLIIIGTKWHVDWSVSKEKLKKSIKA